MASDYWACARLCAGHERLAVHCLTKVSRYEIYQPRTVERRVVRGRKVNVTAALFPAISSSGLSAVSGRARPIRRASPTC